MRASFFAAIVPPSMAIVLSQPCRVLSFLIGRNARENVDGRKSSSNIEGEEQWLKVSIQFPLYLLIKSASVKTVSGANLSLEWQ